MTMYLIHDKETLKQFYEDLSRELDKGKVIVLSNSLVGNLRAPNKKKPYFQVSFAIAGEVFKKFDEKKLKRTGFTVGLGELFDSRLYSLAIIDRDRVNVNWFLEAEKSDDSKDH